MTPEQYIKEFYVTNVYALYINKKIESILFISDYSDIVYLENITYNTEYSKYSLGTILYYYMIEDFIKKVKKFLYLD